MARTHDESQRKSVEKKNSNRWKTIDEKQRKKKERDENLSTSLIHWFVANLYFAFRMQTRNEMISISFFVLFLSWSGFVAFCSVLWLHIRRITFCLISWFSLHTVDRTSIEQRWMVSRSWYYVVHLLDLSALAPCVLIKWIEINSSTVDRCRVTAQKKRKWKLISRIRLNRVFNQPNRSSFISFVFHRWWSSAKRYFYIFDL